MSTPLVPPATDPEPGWSQDLADGAPGVLLLYVELAQSGLGPWRAVQQWASAATRETLNAHPSASLYSGVPAVAFALSVAGREAYAGVLDQLDHDIRRVATQRLAAAHERLNRGEPAELAEFDLISGLTGIGAYLMHRGTDPDTLRHILAYLVRLAQPTGDVPGWWSRNSPADVASPEWPGGHGNFGMAHGIAGPLALLSIAMRRGVTVAGQDSAIDDLSGWLRQWQHGDADPWWPETITRDELGTGRSTAGHPPRPSWCYGTPGIARALQLAGLALADRHRQQVAEKALTACVRDDHRLAMIKDASVCHGWAGLILCLWRVASDSTFPHPLTDRLPALLGRLDRHLRDHPLRTAGLLTGAAGVDLVQRTTARSTLPASRWDACLLLDG